NRTYELSLILSELWNRGSVRSLHYPIATRCPSAASRKPHLAFVSRRRNNRGRPVLRLPFVHLAGNCLPIDRGVLPPDFHFQRFLIGQEFCVLRFNRQSELLNPLLQRFRE